MSCRYTYKGKVYSRTEFINEVLLSKPLSEIAEYVPGVDGVPDAPLKQTEQWAMLGFKRMLRYAVENGYERMAWTPGQVQADRYDLSKRIDEIRYYKSEPEDNFTYRVLAIKNGDVVIQKNVESDSDLERLVGKEIAKKIVDGEGQSVAAGGYMAKDSKSLTGVDLKVGGEGMRGFYDKILPKAVGKYVKKWGAKVEVKETVTGSEIVGYDPTMPPTYTLVPDRGGLTILEDGEVFRRAEPGDTEEFVRQRLQDLKREAEESYRRQLDDYDTIEKTTEVWSIPITEKMKESVSEGQPLFSPRSQPDTRNEMTWRDELLSKFVNRYQAQENIQKDIEAKDGELPETEDTSLAVTLYPGVTRALVDEFEEQDILPLMAAIDDTGISFDALGEFLTARHVVLDNVNDTLRKRNPDLEDNEALSGITDDEAREIMDRYRDNNDVQTIAGFIDSINHRRVDHLVESDLLTPEEAEKWRSLYSHYVPLNREDVGMDVPSRGRGFDNRPKASKLRAGSTKKVDYENVVARVLSQYETTLVRGEKNRVAQTLYRMIEAHPDPELWTLAKVVTKRIKKKDGTYRYMDKIVGDIATRPQLKADGTISRVPDLNASNLMMVRFGGKPAYITFNTSNEHAAKIARAMMNLDAGNYGRFVRGLHTFNRFLSTINTSLSPEFVISNFFRDVQTAGYNLTDTEIRDLEGKVLKSTPKALVGIRSFLRGDKGHELAPWFDRFRKAGGQTGWIQSYENIGDRTKAMERELKFWRKPGMGQIKGLFKLIEDYNNVVENAVRLATFKAAVEAGLTDKKAARIAKQVTVDFNRRGEYGVMMNALYLFYNAGIQGSARLLRATLNPKNHRLHKMLVATVIGAAALDILNRAIGGDDDDGEPKYDKIREMYGERNLIIMNPWAEDGYLKIPLPWGYNTFHVLGQEFGAAIDAARGAKFEWDPLHSAFRLMSTVGNAFNPMQDGSLLQTISPTISDPLVRIAENKDWHGGPLYPNYDKSAPNYTKFYTTARKTSRDVAKWLYEAGLNKETQTSWLDVSPEWLDMGVDFVTGSAGRLAVDTAGFTKAVLNGEGMEWRQIPLARKMVGEVGTSQRKRQFYEKLYEIIDVDKALRRIKKDPEKTVNDYREALEGVGDRAKLINVAKSTKRRLSKMRKSWKKAKLAGNKERTERLEENMMKLMMSYTSRYNRTLYGYSGDQISE